MTTKTTAEELVTRQTEAWNRHDPAAIAAAYAQDVTVLDPYYPEPLSGRDAVQKDAADFFTAFPDLAVRVTKVMASGDTVAFEGIVNATHTGPLQLPAGLIPPTNKRLEFSIASFSTLDGSGHIREERRYYDVAGQLTQLGLLQ